jgi:hypothetical protein
MCCYCRLLLLLHGRSAMRLFMAAAVCHAAGGTALMESMLYLQQQHVVSTRVQRQLQGAGHTRGRGGWGWGHPAKA